MLTAAVVVVLAVGAWSSGMGRNKAYGKDKPRAAAPACMSAACAGVTVIVMVICCIFTNLVNLFFLYYYSRILSSVYFTKLVIFSLLAAFSVVMLLRD